MLAACAANKRQLFSDILQILDDPETGEETRKLYDDAHTMREGVSEEKWPRVADSQ